MALYVYGIVRARDAARVVRASRGARALRAVDYDKVSALVSATQGGPLTVRRDNILAHSDVLQTAFEHGPVLPLRFGTVLPDEESVVRELLKDGPQLGARLDALDGKVEMRVKATYLEEPLLRSVLARDRRLARAVQRNRKLPAAATHFERIRVGEAIARAVEARRLAEEQALLSALGPLSLAVSSSLPHHERALLNASFLVERSELGRFDAAVEGLSSERGADAEFSLIGPLPPYSFSELEWERGAEEASAAWA
jgi:hypothetical protein